jgi:hypothetical protein
MTLEVASTAHDGAVTLAVKGDPDAVLLRVLAITGLHDRLNIRNP